jgi:uncharacterized membrane-anchored protein YhcB (DUF1043 family)
MFTFNVHSHFKSTSEFLKHFLDLAQHQDKTFDYWIDELGHLVPKKDTFAPFEQQIRSALQDQTSGHNPDTLFAIFLQHKHIGGHMMQIELVKNGIAKVKAAFKERLTLHHRLKAAKKTHLTFLIGLQQYLKHMSSFCGLDEQRDHEMHHFDKTYRLLRNIMDIYAQPAPKEESYPFDIPSSSYTLETI